MATLPVCLMTWGSLLLVLPSIAIPAAAAVKSGVKDQHKKICPNNNKYIKKKKKVLPQLTRFYRDFTWKLLRWWQNNRNKPIVQASFL